MKKMWIAIGIVAILLIVGGTYFFLNKPAPGLPPTTEEGTYNIEISGFSFNPKELIIKTGETVIWTNQDLVSHTITSDSGNELASEKFSRGETYSHTFNTAGTYTYHCAPHPGMEGTIIVE
ncbi:plastocyanin/azurin family copper-binding protein [Candidatus Pacearchaeota archaeon]|nr:plastocyanin/azurin family copper-binding protein [Candidatus Pacearchaeota archaeon]